MATPEYGITDMDIFETCEECGRPVRAIELDDHECDPEDIAARAAYRREAQTEAYD